MSPQEEFPHYIEFRQVSKTFDMPVLVDCSFQIDAGETVAIIGRSGVGGIGIILHDGACTETRGIGRRIGRRRKRGSRQTSTSDATIDKGSD